MTKLNRNPNHWILGAALAFTLTACGDSSDDPSDVHTTRVLAVRADTPFAKPGSTVTLSMLSYDGSPRAQPGGVPRATTTLWLGGCVNPDGDSYTKCMPLMRQTVQALGDGPINNSVIAAHAAPGLVGTGNEFAATVPADITTSRPVAKGVVHRYGLQYVFFAFCGGELRYKDVSTAELPLGCYDAATGVELGRDDYEFGFFPLFAYDTLENHNPVIESVHLAAGDTGPSCSAPTDCAEGWHCGSAGACIPVVQRCTAADADNCPNIEFGVEVARSSVEKAVVAYVSEAEAKTESLWVSYYANAGSFDEDSRTVNDPSTGWNDDTVGKWRAKLDTSREVRLWAVVRDRRSGVAYAWRDLWVN